MSWRPIILNIRSERIPISSIPASTTQIILQLTALALSYGVMLWDRRGKRGLKLFVKDCHGCFEKRGHHPHSPDETTQ